MLARSPLLLALMAGERVEPPSGSAPSRSEASQETIRSSPAHRGGRPVDFDDQRHRRPASGAEAAGRRCSSASRPDGRGAGGACQHELAHRQPAARLQVVEAMASPSARACERSVAARAHPAQGAEPGTSGRTSSPTERSSAISPATARRRRRRRRCGSRERRARPPRREHRRWRARDQATSGWLVLHVRERVNVQDLGRQRGHLVGGHHPRAEPSSSTSWCSSRQPQPPARDRAHAARCMQHDVHCGRVCSSPVPSAPAAPLLASRSSPAPVRATRRCRLPGGAGAARPSRACSARA